MTASASPSVLILGAGLTGLAIAYHLQRSGFGVTILHHSPWTELSADETGESVSVLFGGYHETWRLLRELGTAPSRPPTIPIEFDLLQRQRAAYRSLPLPGKLHWPLSVLAFAGLSWNDRWHLFSRVEQLWEGADSLPADLESRFADDWLASLGQSQDARRTIWDPLARLIVGTPLKQLSAGALAQTLTALFLRRASDAQAFVAHDVLRRRLREPLERRLRQAGVTMRHTLSPPLVRFAHDRVAEVQLREGATLQADRYVAVVPPRILPTLLPERLLTRYASFAHLNELREIPRVAVELALPAPCSASRLILSAEGPFDQLTIAVSDSSEALARLCAVGDSPLEALQEADLIARARGQVLRLLPHVKPHSIHPVAARQDTLLALSPGTARLRPIQRSPIPNLLVAGAWTDTGWPPQLESALLSARRCAETIGVRCDGR